MPNFKVPNDPRPHWLSDEDIASGGKALLPTGAAEISDEEARAMLSALTPKATESDVIRRQIAELESHQTPRRIREALLSGDHSFIESIEAQIAVLRNQLA